MASAQNGIMSPLLLGRKILEYIYPSEEAVNTVEAAPANYKKGLTNELLQRQAYKESTFNPAAVSPAGYKGLTQIGEGVLEDYSNKKGGKKLDPFNPKDAVELQKFAMDDLYNASFINKPDQSDSVRIAKTLAAYNWGRGNLANYLNEQKDKGVDIYDSYDWLNNLPKETSDYVNKILLQEDPSFNKNYKKASTNPKYEEVTSLYDQKKFGGNIPSAQKGKNDIEKISINDPRYPELYKNRQVGSHYDGAFTLPDLPEVVVTGKDERIKEGMSQGSGRFLQGLAGVIGSPQTGLMEVITGKQQTPSEAWGFQQPDGWLDSYSSFGKNLSNLGMDVALDPLNALGIGVVDDVIKMGAKSAKTFLPKAISQIPSPQMIADNVVASATPNALTVTNPQQTLYRELNHPQMDLLQELKQKTIDRLNTPEGKKRLQYMINKNFWQDHKSWGKPTESWGEFFLEGLKNFEFSGYKKIKPEDIIEQFKNLKFVESSNPYSDKFNAHAGFRGNYPNSFPIMNMGEDVTSPKDIAHIFEHEIAHHFQRGADPSNLDDQLRSLELKKQPSSPDLDPSEKILEDSEFSATGNQSGFSFEPSIDYFRKGSGGREKLPFAAEIRESLLRRGKIKDYYDEITPQMLEDHYDLYNKTGGNKYVLRLYEIMEKTPRNFKVLSETLNKIPTVTLPVSGGAAAATSALQNNEPLQIPKKQNGGKMRFYQNGLDWKPRSMQDGGEESFGKKLTNFVSEGISGPVTTVALGLLDMVKPISNSEIYKTVRPVGYPNALRLPMYAYDYLMGNESEPLKTKSGKPHLAEEFWATAMSMPGERQYLKESKYKPSVAKDPDAKYYTIRDIIDQDALIGAAKDLKAGEKMEMNGLLPILNSKWYSENADTDKNLKFGDIDPLQRFTLQKSPDGSYVSIYDKYDFNNPALNKMMNPIEIYDRFYLPKKRKGGVIKDNRGQWAHPGKVTEIDSNYITMEGVPYDVVGVSDAGDTKLMKPGKNYKFKGKKVTEFPVAELGINQLDAQPMKKLNQLLNFTNNPDKDNWLDKYN
jgi:hypothetical protein